MEEAYKKLGFSLNRGKINNKMVMDKLPCKPLSFSLCNDYRCNPQSQPFQNT